MFFCSIQLTLDLLLKNKLSFSSNTKPLLNILSLKDIKKQNHTFFAIIKNMQEIDRGKEQSIIEALGNKYATLSFESKAQLYEHEIVFVLRIKLLNSTTLFVLPSLINKCANTTSTIKRKEAKYSNIHQRVSTILKINEALLEHSVIFHQRINTNFLK